MLSGGAGILVFIPNTGRILVQIRGEHPDDKDSGKYDLFGGTLEEGETAEECARREAKEEGDLDFPEGELEEIGAFSSTENGDWDGEPYHVFLSIQDQEFPVKIDQDEVAKAGWIEPDVINDENSTNRLVKVLQHEKLAGILHQKLESRHNKLILAQHNKLTGAQENPLEKPSYYQHKFPFWSLKGSTRRFLYNSRNDIIVIGIDDDTNMLTHAQEFSLSGAPGHYDSYRIRGWIKFNEQFKYGIVDFVNPPFIVKNQYRFSKPGAREIFAMLKRSGASSRTVLTNPISPWSREVPQALAMGEITEAQHNKLISAQHNKLTEAHLVEKTWPVSKDVDYIFSTYYGKLFKDIKAGFGHISLGDFKDIEISSEELPSAVARKAHAANPITIKIKSSEATGNFYNPVEKELQVSPSDSAMHVLRSSSGSIKRALNIVQDDQQEPLKNEFNGVKIKTSIAHELSHWFNDTFHNQHIRDIITKGRTAKAVGVDQGKLKSIMARGLPDIYMSDYEIDAQIHQLKELRRRYKKIWDTLSFENLTTMDRSLGSSSRRIRQSSTQNWKKWKMLLLKRLAREGLLGAKMKGAPVGEAAYPYRGYNFPGDWYHGMASSSRAFVRRKGNHPSNIGIWLTNNKHIATDFAKQASRRMVDDVPVLVTAKTVAENPMVFDTYREYLDAWREFGDSEKMRRSLMRKGHDSVLIAKSDTDFGGEPRMDLAVFKTSEIRVTDKEKMAAPVRESDSILDAVLAEPGQNPGIGDEKEKKITPEISMLVSPYGSYRFIYRKGGKIVSGLQVVSRDGKNATTANVKTHPDFLRQGLAKELLGVARRKFKKVDHSEHLTDVGSKFAQGTGD